MSGWFQLSQARRLPSGERRGELKKSAPETSSVGAAAIGGGAFLDGEKPAPVGVEDEVGVAGPVGCSQGDGGVRGCEVDALVGEVDEGVGRRIVEEAEGAAAVLVDAAADVEAVGREGAGAAVEGEADEDVAAALLGAAFEPANVVAGGGEVVDAAGALGDGPGGDRRRPGAVRGGGARCVVGHRRRVTRQVSTRPLQ